MERKMKAQNLRLIKQMHHQMLVSLWEFQNYSCQYRLLDQKDVQLPRDKVEMDLTMKKNQEKKKKQRHRFFLFLSHHDERKSGLVTVLMKNDSKKSAQLMKRTQNDYHPRYQRRRES